MSESTAPPEPPCPANRVPHRSRVAKINYMLKEGQTAAVCIDDTSEHRAWYLHELASYPRLTIIDQCILMDGIYSIKVRKEGRPPTEGSDNVRNRQ